METESSAPQPTDAHTGVSRRRLDVAVVVTVVAAAVAVFAATVGASVPVTLGGDTASGGYAFVGVASDGTPASWPGCGPLSVTISTRGASADQIDEVIAAFDRFEALGFVTFSDPVFSDEVSFDSQFVAATGSDVTVGFVSEAEAGDLFVKDDGGTRGAVTVFSGDVGSAGVLSNAGLVINADAFAGYQPSGPYSFGVLLDHELGHVAGLDHVDDTSALMHPATSGDRVGFGPGDLAGLRVLYRSC